MKTTHKKKYCVSCRNKLHFEGHLVPPSSSYDRCYCHAVQLVPSQKGVLN